MRPAGVAAGSRAGAAFFAGGSSAATRARGRMRTSATATVKRDTRMLLQGEIERLGVSLSPRPVPPGGAQGGYSFPVILPRRRQDMPRLRKSAFGLISLNDPDWVSVTPDTLEGRPSTDLHGEFGTVQEYPLAVQDVSA